MRKPPEKIGVIYGVLIFIILAWMFTYAGWSRGRMEGYKVGYEIGWEMRDTSPHSPPTTEIW